MKKIIIYSYLKCSTCRKAIKWLDKENLEYLSIDIVKEPPLSKYLNLAFEQYSEKNTQLTVADRRDFRRFELPYA